MSILQEIKGVTEAIHEKKLTQQLTRPTIIFPFLALCSIVIIPLVLYSLSSEPYVFKRVVQLGGYAVREKNFMTDTIFLKEIHCFDRAKQIETKYPEILGLKYPDVTEEDMKLFGQCEELERLMLVCNSITDDWLVHLISLKKLNSVHIYSEGLTDEAFKYLSQIKSIRVLVIRSSAIKGEGLRELNKLPKLSYINITSRNMTDKGAYHLSKCPHIKGVSVCFSKVTDEGLRLLCKNDSLNRLYVMNTQVTPVK